MLRGTVLGAAALALLSSCSAPGMDGAPPPAMSSSEAMAPPPAPPPPPMTRTERIESADLLGGPPASARPVPPPPAPVLRPVAMAPIPNPEDMTPAERARVYGNRRTPAPIAAPAKAAAKAPAPVPPARYARVTGPVPASSTRPIAMAPIPNPPERSRTARRGESRTVGGYARTPQPDRPPVSTTARGPVFNARPTPPRPAAPVIKAPAAPAPRPAPKAAPAPARPIPAPVAKAAPPAPKAAAPAPKIAAPAPKAAAPAPKAATPAPKMATPSPKVAAPKTKPEQLGVALAGDVTGGSKLDIPQALREGKKGTVVLSLPANLLDRLHEEAAKLGLTRQARTADARASLTGEGYSITPNASQAYRLKSGEPTTFSWEVQPQGAALPPLKAEVGGELKAGARPQAFTIASIEQAVALPPAPAPKKGFRLPFGLKMPSFGSKAGQPAAESAVAPAPTAAAAAGSKRALDALTIPGMKEVDVPGYGKVPSSNLVAIGLGVLAVLLLAALSNRAASRRRAAERRRKFRTMADFGGKAETFDEPARTPEPVH